MFQNGGRPPSWIFEIQIFDDLDIKKPILHHHAKFCEDRSNRCWDITIFMIFKTAVATILDIQKFEILSVSPLSEANMLHHAKLHQNQSNGCGDMAI